MASPHEPSNLEPPNSDPRNQNPRTQEPRNPRNLEPPNHEPMPQRSPASRRAFRSAAAASAGGPLMSRVFLVLSGT